VTKPIDRTADSAEFASPVDQQRWWRRLGLIVAAALVLRLFMIWVHGTSLDGGDEPQYFSMGSYLAENWEFRHTVINPVYQGGKNGELTAHRSPVLPAVLGATQMMFGSSLLAPRVLMVILGALTVLLIGLAGRAAGSPTTGLVAAGLWAVWPPAVLGGYSSDRLSQEGLGVFLLVLHFWLLLRALGSRHARDFALAGLVLGLAVLTRGYLLFAVPLLALFLLWKAGPRRLLLVGAFVATAAVPIGAWMLRNLNAVGKPVLSTQTEAFYLGNNAWARGSYDGEINRTAERSPQLVPLVKKYPNFWQMTEVERSQVWTREGLDFLLADLPRAFWLMARKTAIFFSPLQVWSVPGYRHHWGWVLMLLLLPAGILDLRRQGRTDVAWLSGLLVLSTYIAVLMTYAMDRYRYPIEPFVVLLGSFGIVSLARRWAGARLKRGAPAITA
jgi:4-amino-4-deoxy-L-arabinose transferase-like glycosyltransferase